MSDAITESRLLIGGLLIAFLVLSLASSVFVVRALQGQIDNFLQAARRLGSGDLSERVPVQGDDEFAALGQEFNTMAEQLETHVDEVERKRRELEDSIRRIGEAFGTGLDRQGLVDLAVRTADRRRATRTRAAWCPWTRASSRRSGSWTTPRCCRALEAAERQVLAPGPPGRAGPRGDWRASTRSRCPSSAATTRRARRETIGAISIARRGGDFTLEQCDLLAYLTTQTAVSLENADLHRRISAPGDHRRADRALERAPLPRAARPGDRARPALQQPHRARDGRHRQLQAGERHLRASAGRPRAEGGRAGAAGAVARHRLPGPLRRRGDVGDPARRPTSAAPRCSPSACARRSRSCASGASTARACCR